MWPKLREWHGFGNVVMGESDAHKCDLTLKALKYGYINQENKCFRFIWINMLWVYRPLLYKYFTFSVRDSTLSVRF